jgi:hypothetical protein
MNSTTVNLCRDLLLSIDLEGDQIVVTLRDDLTLNETQLCYPLSKVSRYHLQEGIVIAMRRLITQAVNEGLISGFPGEQMSLSRPTPAPCETLASFTLSSTEPEL